VHSPSPHLILTLDYEVFGNGSGCIEHCVLQPGGRVLEIAERYRAPVTLFVEALEFMAMERHCSTATGVRRVGEQLRCALQRGHDVQLHLHPQWDGAKAQGDGAWELDFAKWRTGDLAAEDVERLLAEGKRWLEGVVQPARPDHRIQVFRAGGWCIQPSKDCVAALQSLGFSADSTVAPGLVGISKEFWFDFRAAPQAPWWHAAGDVCTPSGVGLLEVPIAVGSVSRAHRAAALLGRSLDPAAELAAGCRGSYQGRNSGRGRLRQLASKLSDLGRAMLDFSVMPAELMKQVVMDWRDRYDGGPVPLPIVAIGHSKNFTDRSAREMERFLQWATDEGELELSSYSQWFAQVAPAAGAAEHVTAP
jgi:hypothetical protein